MDYCNKLEAHQSETRHYYKLLLTYEIQHGGEKCGGIKCFFASFWADWTVRLNRFGQDERHRVVHHGFACELMAVIIDAKGGGAITLYLSAY